MWHDMSMPVIIHHANCPDGFGSAWLFQQEYPGLTDIVAASHGDPLPDEINGTDVVVLDFCYPSDQLTELCQRTKSVLILDHHQTTKGYLADSPFEVYPTVRDLLESGGTSPFKAVLDESRSGVGLVMQFVKKEVPFLYNIEDRDLWKFELDDTADVFAAVTSRPYTVEAWDEIEAIHPDDLRAEGAAINRFRDKLIADIVDTAAELIIPTWERVWVAAAPFAVGSDVAGVLAKRDPEWYAAYYVPYGNKVRFGLRSAETGKDVAKLAEKLGGGGHKHASGFEVDLWVF